MTSASKNALQLDLSRVALKHRRTKIVATVGPSSSTDEMIERLIVAGVNVFRLNFSHGTHAMHGENIARIRKLADYYKDARPDPDSTVNPVKIDRQLTFDRLTNVHYSGTRHPEDQPSHLIVHDANICATRCREEYGNPCIRFCPANVYEMVDDGAGKKKLQINASNCVHCKACDIKDPYTDQITWVTPEGGSGPNYQSL